VKGMPAYRSRRRRFVPDTRKFATPTIANGTTKGLGRCYLSRRANAPPVSLAAGSESVAILSYDYANAG
jgi:hypothetical protein